MPTVPTPSTALDALALFALLGFVVVHASLAVGRQGLVVYVATSYVVYGWIAWSLAGLITRAGPRAGSRAHRVVTPVVTAFILAGWDFGDDAIGSTVRDLYTYRDPSGFMGVPLSNFLGWLLSGWVIFQLFALLVDRFSPATTATVRRGYRLWPCAIWALVPVQYLADFASAPETTVERGGRTFAVADVYEASATAAILTMLFTAVIAGSHAWHRPGDDEPAEDASQQPPCR
ncbi:carotenoid biosynthesis protein [Parafrankia sp. FMc2]|uniref:carotenoid biosynthesis protein n=1 Tax=Parafrankia sp. FMc2 TaxID=3233196 RepID=UPI0034D4ACB3